MIRFSDNFVDEEKSDILRILPQWETYVLHAQKNADGLPEVETLHFLVAAKSREEFRKWLAEFEDKTTTRYSVWNSRVASGKRVVVRQTLVCHHKTSCERTHDPSVLRMTKNTNCPSKMNVTIHSVHDENHRYRGKFAGLENVYRLMPCEVKLTLKHNHSVGSAAALRFRQPSDEVQATLKSLFQKGHSPASALQCIKTDILLKYADYALVLGDRSKCPDYKYCYNLDTKLFKKKYGPMDFNKEGKEVLQQRLQDYNAEVGSMCSKMIVKNTEYAICICSPLMKKIHMHIDAASKMVFMDSTGSLDSDGNRVFVLLTHSECGGLPLGIIVTSSESCEALAMGFQLLREIVGENIFGGNIDGPKIFLTDDCRAEQNAIRTCFSKSTTLLCIFHVLQAVWRWLIKSKHGIAQEKQMEYFQDFRKIMHSKTKARAEKLYNAAKANICEEHKHYRAYLDGYWERRQLWALSYRIGILVQGHNTNNFSEAFMRILKDRIFDRIRAFNIVQMVDYILTKVNSYFQIRLIDAANNTSPRSFHNTAKIPSPEIASKIKVVKEGMLLVPSEEIANHYYIVNMVVLICTCFQGNTGRICKHIDWASTVCTSQNYKEAIDNEGVRRKFYFIATGELPPENWLEPLYGSRTGTELDDVDVMEQMNTQEERQDAQEQRQVTQEETQDTVHDENNSRKINNDLLARALAHLTELSNRSPDEMRMGLEALCEVEKINTPSACTSLLLKLREGNARKNKGNYIPVQPTAISRRKKKLVGRRSNPGGRPRRAFIHSLSSAETTKNNIEGSGTSHGVN